MILGNKFDFNKIPGLERKQKLKPKKVKPLITIYTIVTSKVENVDTLVNSVLNQTFPYFNWVIIDTTKNKKWKKLPLEFSNITLINTTTEKLEQELEKLIHDTKTPYTMLLDHHDRMNEQFLEYCYWTLEKNENADLVTSNQIIIGLDGNDFFDGIWDKRELNAPTFTTRNPFIKTEMLKELYHPGLLTENPEFGLELWYKILEKEHRIVHSYIHGIWYVQDKVHPLDEQNKKYWKKINHLLFHHPERMIQYPVMDEYHYNTYPKQSDWKQTLTFQKKKINLLFFFPWFTMGGGDQFNVELLKHLDPEKFNITILTTDLHDSVWLQRFEPYAEIFELMHFLPRKDWPNFIDYIIKTRNIDVIMMSNSLYMYYLTPWIKYCYPKLPVLDYIHAQDFSWRDGGFPRDSNAICKYLDATYTCSEYLKNLMYNEMEREVHNVKAVYIGVDDKKFDPYVQYEIPDDLKEAMPALEGKKKILFLGRIHELKRPIFALKLLQKILEHRNDVVLLMVGSGPEEEFVSKYIAEYGLQNSVFQFGMHNETRPFYQASDVSIICSLTEGITLTSYEAISMGVPVVSAIVGGQQELINEETGRLIPMYQDVNLDQYNYEYDEEELERYMKDIEFFLDESEEEKEKRMKACHDHIVKYFSLDIMGKTMSEEFEKFAKSGSQVNPVICDNKNLAINYLIMNNEFTKKGFVHDRTVTFQQRLSRKMKHMVAKLWRNKLYRNFVHFCQKIGITKLKRKLLNREN